MAHLVAGPVEGPGASLPIDGVSISAIPRSLDDRGSFAKPYSRSSADPQVVREVFWSQSAPGVVRGLHVQGPTNASAKDVFLTTGRVFDVVLDLRKRSVTYGQFRAFILDPTVSLHVPHGCAHGFQALEPTTMVYLCDVPYDPTSDHGIRFDSLGIPWPIANPVVSARDLGLPEWHHYESPFP